MTSQRLVEDFARWLMHHDEVWYGDSAPTAERIPDNYLNEAAVFLAGELGQRLQRGKVAEPTIYNVDGLIDIEWHDEPVPVTISPELLIEIVAQLNELRNIKSVSPP